VAIGYSQTRPKIIQMDFGIEDDGRGGVVVFDLNGDRLKDFIVTRPGLICAYDNSGKKRWLLRHDILITVKAEANGLPGWHAPGIQIANGQNRKGSRVYFLSSQGALVILDGATGRKLHEINLIPPQGAEHWEHLVIANFRGRGDRDLLLQATNAKGYRMGRYLAAFAIDDLLAGQVTPLWQRDDFLAAAHTGARIADLDGDGLDEVLGGSIIESDGKKAFQLPVNGHIDAVHVADVRPDIRGLEVVALEEKGWRRVLKGRSFFARIVNYLANKLYPNHSNRVFLYNKDRLIWESHYKRWEPQNTAIGNYEPHMKGLEIWCRSRFDTDQKPFVLQARGSLIGSYEMKLMKPPSWTNKGVEEISTIDWTGADKQLAAAKERHSSGDVAIFDPLTGQFLQRFKEKADRIYVADVYGDWREELIVLNGNELHIYRNSDPNLSSIQKSLWDQQHYRRSKMTYNYYSP
jgi:hypothetical protein